MNLGSFLFVCFKTGLISFGGNLSLVAVFKSELEKSEGSDFIDFSELIAITSFLPGPMAANTVALVGYRLFGISGALLGLLAVLLPCFIMVTLLVDFFQELSDNSVWDIITRGIYLAIVVVIFQVGFGMWKKYRESISDDLLIGFSIALVALITFYFNAYASIIVIAIFGIGGSVLFGRSKEGLEPVEHSGSVHKIRWVSLALVVTILVAWLFWEAIWVYSLLGMTLFGGGYVFVHMAQGLLVETLELVSYQEYMDGIAIGQITPGPIMISVAVYGYQISGMMGAILATFGFFVPPALVAILISELLDRFKTGLSLFVRFSRPAIVGIIIFAGASVMLNTLDGHADFSKILMLFQTAIVFFISLKYKLIPVATIVISVFISGTLHFI